MIDPTAHEEATWHFNLPQAQVASEAVEVSMVAAREVEVVILNSDRKARTTVVASMAAVVVLLLQTSLLHAREAKVLQNLGCTLKMAG
jgi:isocitrate dehydrogenase kinase/phosphatase